MFCMQQYTNSVSDVFHGEKACLHIGNVRDFFCNHADARDPVLRGRRPCFLWSGTHQRATKTARGGLWDHRGCAGRTSRSGQTRMDNRACIGSRFHPRLDNGVDHRHSICFSGLCGQSKPFRRGMAARCGRGLGVCRVSHLEIGDGPVGADARRPGDLTQNSNQELCA